MNKNELFRPFCLNTNQFSRDKKKAFTWTNFCSDDTCGYISVARFSFKIRAGKKTTIPRFIPH